MSRALMSFRSIVGSAKRHFMSVRQRVDISGAQLWALWQTHNAPGLTVMELAGKMSIHQSTTSNLIEKLEVAGYLRRTRDTRDRRVVRLFCTPAGARILKKAPAPLNGILPEAISRLSDEELILLEKALALLSREVGDSESRAGARPLSDLLS